MSLYIDNKTEISLTWLVEQEKNGFKFCRLGFEDDFDTGQPFFIKGQEKKCLQGEFTFETVDDLLSKYNNSKYGDKIIVLNFTKLKEKYEDGQFSVCVNCGYNSYSRSFLKSSLIFVEDIIPLNSEAAISFILANIIDSPDTGCLRTYFQRGEAYYEVTRSLEKQLIQRFPETFKKHTITGMVDVEKGVWIFKNTVQEKRTFEIDYVDYCLFLEQQRNEPAKKVINDPLVKPYIVNSLQLREIELR